MGEEWGVSGASLVHNFVSLAGSLFQIHGPDPTLDHIEECGPYLLCIRPPNLLTDEKYVIRLYHKDSKEVVMAVDDDQPVNVYCADEPDVFLPTCFGMCWWWAFDYDPFFVMYSGRLVCRWGGEMVIKQLQYERGKQSLL